MKNNPCCPLCEIYLPYKEKNEYQCRDRNCPCHALPEKAECSCGVPNGIGTHHKEVPCHGLTDCKECSTPHPQESKKKDDGFNCALGALLDFLNRE